MNQQSKKWNTSTIVLAVGSLIVLNVLIIRSMQNDVPPVAAVADNGGAPLYRYFDPATVTIEFDEFGRALPVYSDENTVAGRGELKAETILVDLQLDEGVEYKVMMQQGDSVVYSWKSDGGMAYFDFHAHDDAGGPDFFTRYGEGEAAEQSGSIVAPYSGQHGWYWLNVGDKPQTITLEVAGFYDEIIKIDLDGY